MDIATLTAAQQSIKALLGLAKGATSAAVDHAVKNKLIDIQQGILDAQSQLADAVSERLDLLHENAELREKVRAFESAKAALDGYELTRIGDGGKFLYKSKADHGHAVEHYACPTCFANGKVSVIQATKTGSQQMHYTCMACKSFAMKVGPSDPPPPLRSSVSPWTSR